MQTTTPIEELSETLMQLATWPVVHQNSKVRKQLRQAAALLEFPGEMGLRKHPLVQVLTCYLEREVEHLTGEVEHLTGWDKVRQMELDRLTKSNNDQQQEIKRLREQNSLYQWSFKSQLFGAAAAGSEAHAVLGLTTSASPAEIRTRHRELSVIHHPDRGGRPEVMSKINAARDQALEVAQ